MIMIEDQLSLIWVQLKEPPISRQVSQFTASWQSCIVEQKLKAVKKLNTATINVLVLNPPSEQLTACVDEANKIKSKKQLLLRNTETNETRNPNTG